MKRVVPGEETNELRVRMAESHFEMLDKLVDRGYAKDRSAAVRKAITEALDRDQGRRPRGQE